MANTDQSVLPLLKLPKKEQRNVCRVMEPLHLLGLSICSKAAKRLVKSSGFKCKAIRLYSTSIQLEFNNWRVVYMLVHELHGHPGEISVRAYYDAIHHREIDDTYYDWTVPSFTVRDWIEHFLWVCNRRTIDYLYCGEEELEYMQYNFVGVQVDQLDVGLESVEETLQLLEHFPCAKSFGFIATLPELEFQKVLIQNFHVLELPYEQKLCLNDLLMCNNVHFKSDNDNLSPKELNQFMKLWMNGSNPRLKSIKVSYKSIDEMVDKEIVLKGTNYRDQTEEMTFRSCEEGMIDPVVLIVRGGYEICRPDGTKATIMIGRDGFEMYIWT